MAVAASAKLWMVSARSATLPDRATTAACRRAVANRATNDHLSVHSPRLAETMEGSIAPCVWAWSCP
jgi:hypothetical protein